jgi:delta11-fatty-acid desaturase
VLGVNVFHDGSHFALSRNWIVNAAATYYGFYFSSPLEWYHQHVIGHHAYVFFSPQAKKKKKKEGGDWRINMSGVFFLLVVVLCSYPNVPKRDPDLHHDNMMERHTSTLRWKPMHGHQVRAATRRITQKKRPG